MRLDYDLTDKKLHAYAWHLIPRRYESVTFENSNPEREAQNPECWAVLRAYRGECNLCLNGPCGVGKTHGMACATNAALERGETAALVTGHEISRSPFDNDLAQLMRDAATVKILGIEDIDKAAWNGPGIAALFDLLDKRWSRKRRTIFTSNVSGYEFCARLDAVANAGAAPGAILDRMRPCRGLVFTGESFRRLEDRPEAQAQTPANAIPFQRPETPQADTGGRSTVVRP